MPRVSADRSAGSRRYPAAHYVRFTEEENSRLHRAAKFAGQNITQIMHDGAMEEISKIEEKMLRERSLRGELKRKDYSVDPTHGMGIRARKAGERDREAEPEGSVAPPAAPPTQAAAPSTASYANAEEIIRQLAQKVVTGGPVWRREDRLRDARNALKTLFSQAEVGLLDEEIKKLDRSSGGDDIWSQVKKMVIP